jgi:hypothetical protein
MVAITRIQRLAQLGYKSGPQLSSPKADKVRGPSKKFKQMLSSFKKQTAKFLRKYKPVADANDAKRQVALQNEIDAEMNKYVDGHEKKLRADLDPVLLEVSSQQVDMSEDEFNEYEAAVDALVNEDDYADEGRGLLENQAAPKARGSSVGRSGFAAAEAKLKAASAYRNVGACAVAAAKAKLNSIKKLGVGMKAKAYVKAKPAGVGMKAKAYVKANPYAGAGASITRGLKAKYAGAGASITRTFKGSFGGAGASITRTFKGSFGGAGASITRTFKGSFGGASAKAKVQAVLKKGSSSVVGGMAAAIRASARASVYAKLSTKRASSEIGANLAKAGKRGLRAINVAAQTLPGSVRSAITGAVGLTQSNALAASVKGCAKGMSACSSSLARTSAVRHA